MPSRKNKLKIGYACSDCGVKSYKSAETLMHRRDCPKHPKMMVPIEAPVPEPAVMPAEVAETPVETVDGAVEVQ